MESPHHTAKLNVLGQEPSSDTPTSVQLLPEGQTRNCPYCYEAISIQARKCWRCHEYFSAPIDDIDDRTYQFARREVLQDCVVDIKKWITRIGFGSVTGLLLLAALSMFRFQDVLEDMVADRVSVATGPVLEATEEKLGESEQVLDDVQDNIRLAQYRISQFDRLDDKLVETESAVLQIEDARQSLETRAGKLADQFGKLESRFINAKRELRTDRDRRLEEMLGNFANRVVTYDKLQGVLTEANSPLGQQLLSALAPLENRQIGLISPYTMSADHPAVVFSTSVRLEWQFAGRDVGEMTYRVQFDTQEDFQSGLARQATTRLTNYVLPSDFPRGPVYWRVEAVDRDGQVRATSDTGHFEFYADSIDRIRHTGVVRVGVACSLQGEFAYFDEQQGRLTGYDIELTRWLAARLLPDMPGVRPVFLGYNWNRLLDSVSRNEVDMIISTITITSDREEEYGIKFSHPYYKTSQAGVVLKESDISNAAQLRGRRLAVQVGTSSETVGEAFTESAQLLRAESAGAAYEALLRGQVDAVITDFDFAQEELRKLGQRATVVVLQESDFPANYSGVRSEEYGIAVAKPETNLMNRLNNAIDAARSGNILETLKQRFVAGGPLSTALLPLPSPDATLPAFQRWAGPSEWRR